MEATKLRNPLLEAYSLYMRPTKGDQYEQWSVAASEPRGDYNPNAPGQRAYTQAMTNAFMARGALTQHCAWAVPNDKAIQAIVDLDMSVVEMGAGQGYWAWLLDQAGVDIIAYDNQPYENDWCAGERWFEVHQGGPWVLSDHTDRALFLCWPYMDDMAAECLAYDFRKLIYIGEGPWGCTANDAFFNKLEAEWEEVESICIPQWLGRHDYMWIYQR